MGRLFDAVAALCGLPERVSFEGQAAMHLEFVADPNDASRYDCPINDQFPAVADWQPLLQRVMEDRTAGVPIANIAARFHNSLASLALDIAQRAAARQIVLTGGCFQNSLLTRRVRATLSENGFHVYTQRVVPPGDGGISLGQILGAMWQVGD